MLDVIDNVYSLIIHIVIHTVHSTDISIIHILMLETRGMRMVGGRWDAPSPIVNMASFIPQ